MFLIELVIPFLSSACPLITRPIQTHQIFTIVVLFIIFMWNFCMMLIIYKLSPLSIHVVIFNGDTICKQILIIISYLEITQL
jgi:hypothetical protein